MPDYEYDVFFSYKRHPLNAAWITNVVSRLEFFLADELGGRTSGIFVDQSHIETGDRWPEVLRHALQHSRSMAAIWSPTYFQSPWCVSEWRSFLSREAMVGASSHGLIAPVRYHDGDFFPDEAKEVQQADFRDFSSTIPAFWDGNRAVEFEPALKAFAASLASVVRRAPPFRPDWPVVEHTGLPHRPVPLERL